MYQPEIFREDRVPVLHALIESHPFATLVTSQADALCADHLPLALSSRDGLGVLQGHIAAPNPLTAQGAAPFDVLAIFQGPQAYVTPGWYPSKQEHGKVVPTWNYAIVHARGTARLIRDPAWLHAHLRDLTDRQERDQVAPWSVDDAPAEFIDRQLRGLVGLEISITALDGKWKVSQNRPKADRAGVEAGLSQASDAAKAMADLVRERGRR